LAEAIGVEVDAVSGVFAELSTEGSEILASGGGVDAAGVWGEVRAVVISFSFAVTALSCPCIWFSAAWEVAVCAVSSRTIDCW